MNLRRLIGGMVVLVLTLGATGCSLEKGFQDGVQSGVSAAIAALIQAPVDQAIAESYGHD